MTDADEPDVRGPGAPPEGVRDAPRWATDRRVAGVAGAVVAVGLAVLLVQTLAQAGRPGGNDFTSYRLATRALAEGGDPHQTTSPFPYRYPPVLAFLLVPMAGWPLGLAVTTWFAANALALVGVSRVSARWGGGAHLTGTLPLLAGLFALGFPIVQSNLRNGQVNLLVLGLTLAALCAARRSRPAVAGLALATATLVKLVPLAVVPFFAVRRRFGVLGWAFGLGAVLAVSPGVVGGVDALGGYTAFAGALARDVAGGAPTEARFPFFHLAGFLRAWAGLPGGLAIDVVGAAIVFGSVLALDAPGHGHRPDRRDPWAFQLYLLAIPLASPIAESHHLAFAIPAVVMLHARLWRDGRDAGPAIAACAVAFWGAMLPALVVQSSSLAFLALVALFAGVASEVRRLSRLDVAEDDER